MKRSTITTVLLVVVLGGLVASTGYAFNLMNSYRDKYESQSKTNEELLKESKKNAEVTKKNTEELEKQKKAIADLEKKNKELTATNTTSDQNGLAAPVNQAVEQNTPITDYTSESDKKVLEDLSVANKEKIAQEEAAANQPQYATYSGYTHPQRFPPDYGLSMDELLALNGLSSVNDLVDGQSYRVK